MKAISESEYYKQQLDYYKEQTAYYKGKSEVYERIFLALGIIKPIEIPHFDKPSKK